jgi:molecular chaperone GrpE
MTAKPQDPEAFDDAQGPEVEQDAAAQAAASEPDQGEETLTVEDILTAPQSDDAAVAEAPEGEQELLLDLKRVQAEYANYRRRTEEQWAIEMDRTKGAIIKRFLPVLDDLDRAEQHGDLAEGSAFAVIAEKIRNVVSGMNVVKFGEAGEAFDPQQHEAVLQQPVPGTELPTILEVVEVGYRLGEVELRPAKVVVAVPAE